MAHERGEQLGPGWRSIKMDGRRPIRRRRSKGCWRCRGHKGYGLALMWEVLTGVGGLAYGANVGALEDLARRRRSATSCWRSIRPPAARPVHRRIDSLIEQIGASRRRGD